jgi:beta-lactamase regulating signal transducer with metallopeptidase domain
MSLIIDYIVNAVWQIPLIAIGAAILTRFGRLSPNGRHRVWLAALALATALPLLPAAKALSIAIAPVRASVEAARSVDLPRATGTSSGLASPTVDSPLALNGSHADRATGLPPIIMPMAWARVVAILWGLIVAGGMLRLALAWRSAADIARRSAPANLGDDISEMVRRTAQKLGVAPPSIRFSSDVRSPVVAGAKSPTILLPPAFVRLAPDEQGAALLHELAHVARKDFAVNLAVEAFSLPISWHPVSWEIKAGARRSREAACDAIASGALGSRDAYARRLISLADALRLSENGETSPAFVALISKSDLEDRLMQLIKGSKGPSRLRLLAASSAAAAVLAPAMLLHVTPAIAQDATPVVPLAAIARPIAPSPAITASPALIARPATAPSAPIDATATPTTALVMVAQTRIARRVLLAQADVPPAPPAPPAPPSPPPPPTPYDVAPPPPPAPPAPPVPPAPPPPDMAKIDAQVRAAMRMAMAQADRAMSSEEVRKAMAQAHVDREAIRREVAEAMNSPEVQRALAQAREMGTIEARQAIEQARQEAMRALDEAEREIDQEAARSRPEHREHDQRDRD